MSYFISIFSPSHFLNALNQERKYCLHKEIKTVANLDIKKSLLDHDPFFVICPKNIFRGAPLRTEIFFGILQFQVSLTQINKVPKFLVGSFRENRVEISKLSCLSDFLNYGCWKAIFVFKLFFGIWATEKYKFIILNDIFMTVLTFRPNERTERVHALSPCKGKALSTHEYVPVHARLARGSYAFAPPIKFIFSQPSLPSSLVVA